MDTIDNLINTLCGNHNIYREILSWLTNFNYHDKLSEKSCIFVVGDPCTGKTYSFNKIFDYLHLSVTYIDTNNCANSIQFKDILFKSLTSSLIQSIENTTNNKVIFLDNFDSLFNTDKAINQTLLQILRERKLKNNPIICITNQEHLKKIGDIKKHCNMYELLPPTNKDILSILKPFKLKSEFKEKLLKIADGNLTKIFENIYTTTLYNYDNNDKNYDVIYLYNLKTYDRNIARNILLSDAWLIPLRFHENLIIEINNRIGTVNIKNKFYMLFINNFCYFDLFMNKNNTECALEIFVSIVYFLTLLKRKRNTTCDMSKFTKILSYLSLQKKYIKHNFNSNFPLYQIGNYHMCLLNRKFIYFN
jgi:hypothetical protein